MKVVFEDDRIILINKPPEQCFHSEDSHVGIVEEVRETLNNTSLFPVHRLDRVTSGGLLFAKSSILNSQLSQLFEAKQVSKHYLAISDKRPKKKQGLISGDMAKARGGNFKLVRSYEKPAITRFEAKRFCLNESEKENAFWAFLLRPETGKTHQLRVACKSLGSPILGDVRYGGGIASRCYLHAWKLEFELDGLSYSLCVPPDENEDELLSAANLMFATS
jgi:tRNA pseudouridine32 synthase / 23S rRNA pseudouridine746 synthase